MPAFNHEAFIGQAVASALMQETDFDFEIVVGEDCSTDDTRAVARQLADRHPGRIRLLEHERNLGIWENDQAILRECRGEFIAWLEADDYWTSPDKLQVQVEFLERHLDCSACFHWAGATDPSRTPRVWRPGPPMVREAFTIDDVLEHGPFAPSCTVVFRADQARPPIAWTKATPFLETTYFARFALHGRIGFLDREMAMFRCRPDGIYGSATEVQNLETAIATHRLLGEHLGVAARDSYRAGLARQYTALSRELTARGRPLRSLVARARSAWWSPGRQA
jgi:glycosyltransferase involved in cell wall biosynthesis